MYNQMPSNDDLLDVKELSNKLAEKMVTELDDVDMNIATSALMSSILIIFEAVSDSKEEYLHFIDLGIKSFELAKKITEKFGK